MRAGVFVESYASTYDVSVLVVNIWNRTATIDPIIAKCVSSIESVSIEEIGPPDREPQLIAGRFEHIHVFRVQMVRFLIPYLARNPDNAAFVTLDLDDFESNLYRRMGHLYALRNDGPRTQMLMARAERFEHMERQAMTHFHQVYVSNSGEGRTVQRVYNPRQLFVVPNAVRIRQPRDISMANGPFTLLFVGTLDYFPNEDGILWFYDAVLPALRLTATIEFRLLIVGSRPRDAVRKLDNGVDVLVRADVPDVRSFYRESHVCIAPIRAASGTRIKILEAMSEAIPILTTSLGAEGLDVEHGRELLIADSPAEFANRCHELMSNPQLRKKLSVAGFRWVKANHSVERISDIIRAIRPVTDLAH
jgi:glycosyltransferase involved in cell wall biosynthesis